jgi:hypothetical protein
MKGNCRKNRTAYDCLKSGCEYAEAWEGVFICHLKTNCDDCINSEKPCRDGRILLGKEHERCEGFKPNKS